MMYNPDKWLVVDIHNGEDHFQKVFTTWAGGYTNGDSWKLNSGITKVEVEDDFYLFYGESGSVYRCHKDMEGIAGGSNHSVLDYLLKKFDGKMEVVKDFHPK
jgi:hypothetical protein